MKRRIVITEKNEMLGVTVSGKWRYSELCAAMILACRQIAKKTEEGTEIPFDVVCEYMSNAIRTGDFKNAVRGEEAGEKKA